MFYGNRYRLGRAKKPILVLYLPLWNCCSNRSLQARLFLIVGQESKKQQRLRHVANPFVAEQEKGSFKSQGKEACVKQGTDATGKHEYDG
jgi:hypothetical protein